MLSFLVRRFTMFDTTPHALNGSFFTRLTASGKGMSSRASSKPAYSDIGCPET